MFLHAATKVMLHFAPAFLESCQDVVSERVSILLQESLGVVEDFSGIMSDPKTAVRHLGLDIEGIFLPGK